MQLVSILLILVLIVEFSGCFFPVQMNFGDVLLARLQKINHSSPVITVSIILDCTYMNEKDPQEEIQRISYYMDEARIYVLNQLNLKLIVTAINTLSKCGTTSWNRECRNYGIKPQLFDFFEWKIGKNSNDINILFTDCHSNRILGYSYSFKICGTVNRLPNVAIVSRKGLFKGTLLHEVQKHLHLTF
jgi:Metallo-peptidase family M12